MKTIFSMFFVILGPIQSFAYLDEDSHDEVPRLALESSVIRPETMIFYDNLHRASTLIGGPCVVRERCADGSTIWCSGDPICVSSPGRSVSCVGPYGFVKRTCPISF
jgi:hypothetical protein